MTATPAVLTPSSDMSAASLVIHNAHGALVPVVDDEHTMRLVGVMADPHVGVRCTARHHSRACPVANHMTMTPLTAVHADDSAKFVMDRMARTRMRHLPVVDDAQRLIGLIAEADIIAADDLEMARHERLALV